MDGDNLRNAFDGERKSKEILKATYLEINRSTRFTDTSTIQSREILPKI